MSDDIVWQLLKNGFCSFRKTTDTKPFCTNMYNATGLCNCASCPLANSNYATVLEEQGSLLLCLKTAERVHTPREQWERIKLSTNPKEAMEQISEETKVGFANHQTVKCKLRFKRLRQVIARTRKIMQNAKARLMPIKKKTERREAIREWKAEIAAKLEKSIEQELLARLSQGIYGDLYQFDKAVEEEREVQRGATRKNIEIEYEEEPEEILE